MPPYTHLDFTQKLLAEFPDLRSEIEDCDGLLHIEMSAFARLTQKAKGAADWTTYQKCIKLADVLYAEPDAALLNALNVSYLEEIDFNGPRGPIAWAYLTPRLQHGWRAMRTYLEGLMALPHKEKPKGRSK